MKYINGVSQKTLEDNALWVVEIDDDYGRFRTVVKGSKLDAYCDMHEGEISDIDWLVFERQPKELKPFFDWYDEHYRELPYFIKDIFEQYGEDKDWRDWNTGDEIWYHGKTFNGHDEFFGAITGKFNDHLIAENETSSIRIDDTNINFIDKLEVK